MQNQPEGDHAAQADSHPGAEQAGFPWRVVVMGAAVVVACVPIYGYFVHVSRDSQLTALVIFACWGASFVSIPASIAYHLAGPKVSARARLVCWLLIALTAAVLIIGIGGLRHTIYELVAG